MEVERQERSHTPGHRSLFKSIKEWGDLYIFLNRGIWFEAKASDRGSIVFRSCFCPDMEIEGPFFVLFLAPSNFERRTTFNLFSTSNGTIPNGQRYVLLTMDHARNSRGP